MLANIVHFTAYHCIFFFFLLLLSSLVLPATAGGGLNHNKARNATPHSHHVLPRWVVLIARRPWPISRSASCPRPSPESEKRPTAELAEASLAGSRSSWATRDAPALGYLLLQLASLVMPCTPGVTAIADRTQTGQLAALDH